MTRPHSGSLLRELAHELRDSLSPVRAGSALLRATQLEPQQLAAAALKIDRALDRTLAVLDAFMLAESCDNRTLELNMAPVSLAQILDHARDLAGQAAAQVQFRFPGKASPVQADLARSALVVASMIDQGLACAARTQPVEVSGGADEQAEILVRFVPGSVSAAARMFETYRSTIGVSFMPLRTARALMELQQGTLTLDTGDQRAWALRARFAAFVPVSA